MAPSRKPRWSASRKRRNTTSCLSIRNGGGEPRFVPCHSREPATSNSSSPSLRRGKPNSSSCRQRFGDKHPTMVKLAAAIDAAQAKLDAESRQRRSGGAQRISGGRIAGAKPDRGAQYAEDDRARAEPERNRIRRAATRGHDQPADLRRAAPTREGSRHFGRAAGIHVRESSTRPKYRAAPCCRNTGAICWSAWPPALGAGHRLRACSSNDSTTGSRRLTRLPTYLKLPCLGLVPRLVKENSRGAPLINNGVPPNFAEAFKSVRTNVQFSSAHEGSRSLVVASTGPGEGKTTRLDEPGDRAGADGPAGHSDRRRYAPAEGARAAGRASGAGTVECARGRQPRPARPSGRTSVPGLWVLPAGRIPPNPAELLGSAALQGVSQQSQPEIRLGHSRFSTRDGGDRRVGDGALAPTA